MPEFVFLTVFSFFYSADFAEQTGLGLVSVEEQVLGCQQVRYPNSPGLSNCFILNC